MSLINAENARQYGDSSKLAARARINVEYTIAEIGWFPWVARQLPLSRGARVLDIGCGPGWFWAAAAGDLPEDLHLTLADLSTGMVEEATARCKTLPFGSVHGHQADATALPFDDGAFDLVVAMHMLYHVAEPAEAIEEMFRVLRPGGFAAVTTNGTGNMPEFYALGLALGSPPIDPGAAAFGLDKAERMLTSRFGNTALSNYPARLRITEPEDVFLALTSYPPGSEAGEEQLIRLRRAIAKAFEATGGVLETEKDVGLLLARKPG